MEEKTNATVSADAIERKIAELRQAMKSADPAELENIKSIIRKNVSFFERMSFAAFLLMNASEGRKHDERPERRPRPERPAEKKNEAVSQPRNQGEAKERPERVIPEGARTLYLNIGKMKHLYPKDLSKRLQAELGITRDDIYMIRIHDKYSFVTMSEENCQKAIEKLTGQDINGRIAKVAFSNK